MTKEWFAERVADGWWIPAACTAALILYGFIYYWDGFFYQPEYREVNDRPAACSNFIDFRTLQKSLIIRDTFFGDRYDLWNPMVINGEGVCVGLYEE